MAAQRPSIRSLEKKWDAENKTKAQRRKARYYYRHKLEILEQRRSPMNSTVKDEEDLLVELGRPSPRLAHNE